MLFVKMGAERSGLPGEPSLVSEAWRQGKLADIVENLRAALEAFESVSDELADGGD